MRQENFWAGDIFKDKKFNWKDLVEGFVLDILDEVA